MLFLIIFIIMSFTKKLLRNSQERNVYSEFIGLHLYWQYFLPEGDSNFFYLNKQKFHTIEIFSLKLFCQLLELCVLLLPVGQKAAQASLASVENNIHLARFIENISPISLRILLHAKHYLILRKHIFFENKIF